MARGVRCGLSVKPILHGYRANFAPGRYQNRRQFGAFCGKERKYQRKKRMGNEKKGVYGGGSAPTSHPCYIRAGKGSGARLPEGGHSLRTLSRRLRLGGGCA